MNLLAVQTVLSPTWVSGPFEAFQRYLSSERRIDGWIFVSWREREPDAR